MIKFSFEVTDHQNLNTKVTELFFISGQDLKH